METTRLEQVMHLLRKAMHLVQEQKSLRSESVQRDPGLLCQSMTCRHQREQGFLAEELHSQRWASLACGCQCDVQFSSFHPSTDGCGHVFDDVVSLPDNAFG